MVSQIKRGVLDFVGAARPSIADPFLPRKIAEGREDEIRECIGCNICRAANNEGAPLRCTQNPTMGEEWRRGWHPERIAPARSDSRVLVVGAGPAGLEASLALGRRGYQVTLAEAGRELGGRLIGEASLPGLAAWIRVRDHRVHMIGKLAKVEIFRESPLGAADVTEFGAEHVVLATGSRWRRDGIGSHIEEPAGIAQGKRILTPDDIFAGATPEGPVMVYDDEHYAVGGALAERLLKAGLEVTYVTPGTMISTWTQMTDEHAFIQKRLLEMGVRTVFGHRLSKVADGPASLACVYTGQPLTLGFSNLILVTGRLPERSLYDDLMAGGAALEAAGIKSVTRIGDCLVPSSIADAVHSGHRYARGLDDPDADKVVRRERPAVASVEGDRP